MSCLLAKIHRPEHDVRKPYTEIGDADAFSGRYYDERYLSGFIYDNDLPCNSTTAFLTPALRNRDFTLTPGINMEGRPKEVYDNLLLLLDDVYKEKVTAFDLLSETLRCLLIYRNERDARTKSMLRDVKNVEEKIPLSSEDIINLIEQHLKCSRASRLPVLVVAAAYKSAENNLGERILPLCSHNAADAQTGALGDLEITLLNDDNVVTCYEMKTHRVSKDDINRALQKVTSCSYTIDNYIFITTEEIEDKVQDYAKSIYELTGGIEMVILDCIGFIRHFLHLFHRLRTNFLDIYQKMLMEEPDSSVRQELKEAFLALRLAAESQENTG
jgi:DNA adenine methylase